MIDDAQWDAWLDKHATTFGLTSDTEIGMLASWREAFESRGYSFAELTEATKAMAANDPPRFRSDHLAGIHSRISQHRFAKRRAQLELQRLEPDRQTCERCAGTALVIVPHPKCVIERRWIHPFWTFAAVCNCRRGALLYANFENTWHNMSEAERAKKPWVMIHMSIGDYEMINSQWWEQMADREIATKADMKAAQATKLTDERLGAILKGIAKDVRS